MFILIEDIYINKYDGWDNTTTEKVQNVRYFEDKKLLEDLLVNNTPKNSFKIYEAKELSFTRNVEINIK